MAGAKVVYQPGLNMHLPETLPPRLFAAGRLLGHVDLDAISWSGRLAGARAAFGIGLAAQSLVTHCLEGVEAAAKVTPVTQQPLTVFRPSKSFVCFCHDVTQKDIRLALGEGFDHVKSAKRYTTATMGQCQGGSCQDNFSHNLLGDLERVRFPVGSVDMTDGWTLMAVFGPQASSLMNRLVAVDIDSPLTNGPLFLATKVHNARVHILNTRSAMGYLIACDRSYGQDLYSSCFHSPGAPPRSTRRGQGFQDLVR